MSLEDPLPERPFGLIAFDWDGTAVASRSEDAARVRKAIERLLELGVYVVVITGTNFQNIDRQLTSAVTGTYKRRMYVCANRGSEAYGFDAQSRPRLLWRRDATGDENRLLTEIAEGVQRDVQKRTGLDIRIVYNRLNRRKIDLIPLSEWQDPPKSAIGSLLQAVEERLKGAGIAGGLHEVYALTEKLSREKGLLQARITTDVKHIEVGLTDKREAVEWMMNDLAAKAGIPAEEVLILGDEFGPIAGFEGSDYKMCTSAARGAVLASVGSEPNGVPPGVIQLGGGPPRFLMLLEEQAQLHELRHGRVEQPLTPDSSWFLEEEGFEPERECEIETLFTVSNGYIGTRGSLQEGSDMSLPATFVAGVYGVVDGFSELAIAPDWAQFKVLVEGEELRLDLATMLEHRRRLDMRRGLLEREWRHRNGSGRITRLRFRRFVSLADRHALVESLELTAENYSGRVTVESAIDAQVASTEGVSLLEAVHITPAPARTGPVSTLTVEPQVLTARTLVRKTALALAGAGIFRSGEDVNVAHGLVDEAGHMGDRWEWTADIGLTYTIHKLVSIYTSRDAPKPEQKASEHLLQLVSRGADAILQDHVRAWGERWEKADITIAGDDFVQQAVRFAMYHLIASANPEDERTSIGARALTGEAYKGHVFWDTEIYMFPFFVFTHPPTARANLMYRYHTLSAACEKARAKGYQGALYPWESTDTGEEATPPFGAAPDGELVPILSGEQEHHISADVAYAVWQYWKATDDNSFFQDAGAEILLLTARFWASRGKLENDGRYHIRSVIGPDEYHETVDDNAYTNVMAQWNLERGVETAEVLRQRWPERWNELAEKAEITTGEIERWGLLAQSMYTGFNPDTNLFEQFKGYFELEHVDLKAYEPRTAPMDVLLGRERIAQTQIVKQPDVVLLMHLLWDRFPPEVREVNFRYYEPRCGHGSSLSPSIHALVAARIGASELASHYFRRALEIDLANNMGNASGGVHAAAQGGLWQAVVFGFAGMRPGERAVTFDPRLPRHWLNLSFPLEWRGRTMRLDARCRPRTVNVTLASGDPVAISLGDTGEASTTISMGQRVGADWSKGSWRFKKKAQL